MVRPACPPPMTSVSTDSAGMVLDLSGLARRRCRRRAHDPAAERGKVALLGLEAAIDQIPAHALRHGERKRRHQSSCGEVVIDIGADAHGDAESVDGGLQRLSVILKL